MERKPMNSKVIVLKNGKVVDSESMRVVIADVVISAGVITQVGDASSCDADVVIDCAGKIVTAGFIDATCISNRPWCCRRRLERQFYPMAQRRSLPIRMRW